MLGVMWVLVSAKTGPYRTSTFKLHSPAHDTSNQEIHVFAPDTPNPLNVTHFPLVAYAHGFLGGGAIDIHGYDLLLHQIASYGIVVAAHASCNDGCVDGETPSRWTRCGGLPVFDPRNGWDGYYAESLKTIEFAHNSSAMPPFDRVNFSLGVGIAGHSMGGQATGYAAGTACADEWNIRAAVLHHPANIVNWASGANSGINVTAPVATFTSTGDKICPDTYSSAFHAALPESTPRLYRDVHGSSHLEPVLFPPIESPYLATFTAAWFNIFLGQSSGRAGPGSTAYEAIFGTGTNSVCHYAKMANCSVPSRAPLHARPRIVSSVIDHFQSRNVSVSNASESTEAIEAYK